MGDYGVTYLSHSVAANLSPSCVCRAQVEIRNDGCLTWKRNPGDGHPVTLALWVAEAAPLTFSLPKDPILPGESFVFPIVFQTPSRLGPFILKFDLVHQNVTFFEEQNAPILMVRPSVVLESESTIVPLGSERRAETVPLYAMQFLNHRLPRTVCPGSRFGVWLHLRNLGSFTWDVDARRNCEVRVVAFIGKTAVATSLLPMLVKPMADVHIHLAVPAPLEPGRHALKIDLAHEGITFFGDRGADTLCLEFEVLTGAQPRGSALFEIALRRNPWFYQPSSGVAFSGDGRPYPIFLDRARGCHVWDTEGRRYIDYTIGWGSALLGHAYPPVQDAIRRHLDCGGTLPLPHPLEMAVTQMLCDEIPCAEMVAFGKNGSDACTLAVRLARLHTGRSVVLTCGYHGWQDWFVERLGFQTSGIPAREKPLTYPFAFNNLSDFQSKLAVHRKELAAVILEPAGASQPGQAPADDVDLDFLECVATQTREAGAVLIFDEIITGFRYPNGGLQAVTGIVPELACFGKALGAGMPIAALTGRAHILGARMPNALYAPTYKGEIYSLAAAQAAMTVYRSEPVAAHVWQFGLEVKHETERISRSLGLAASIGGPPFRFGLVFHEPDPLRLALLRALYLQELLREGMLTYNGVMLPSYAHDERALKETLTAIGVALERVERSLRSGNLHQDLEMPLIGT